MEGRDNATTSATSSTLSLVANSCARLSSAAVRRPSRRDSSSAVNRSSAAAA